MFDPRPLPVEYDHIQDADLPTLISEVNERSAHSGWRLHSLVTMETGTLSNPVTNYVAVLYRENQVLGGAAEVAS